MTNTQRVKDIKASISRVSKILDNEARTAIDKYNAIVKPAWGLYESGKITLEEYATIELPAHSQYIKDLEKVIGDK